MILSHRPDCRKVYHSHLKELLGTVPHPCRGSTSRDPTSRSIKNSHGGVKGNCRPPELAVSRVNSLEGAREQRTPGKCHLK